MISRIVIARWLVIALVGAGSFSLLAGAQTNSAQESVSALELVRATVANEMAAANDSSAKHMFRDHKNTPQGSQTRLYVETREAMAGMTIAYNDKPLSPQQLQGEEGRLAGLVGHPEQLKRKQRQEKEEANRTLSIVKALPDAFLFDYDGTETGTASLGKEGMQLLRLKFRPNPAYRAPSHVEEVLVGMGGFVLIDPASRRIARIDGTLFKDVSFGWGILGHLNKGGHFLVQQQNLDDGSWDISRMRLQFTGKILLFKSIAINSEEVFTDFRSVPADTTFAQGVEMLKAEEGKMAQGGAETAKALAGRSH
jgi:hypothetical protein